MNAIADNDNPGTSPPFTYTAQSQSFAYAPTHRLASASGYYGALSWSYDGVGNRLSDARNGVVSAYAYPATSNRLASVTPSGETARALSYDAAGNIVVDTRNGALGMNFSYDVEGRLATAAQTGNPAIGGSYAYDALGRLASRTANAGPGQTTTLYVHDINNHIIAETSTAGTTLREYIWLDDLPVAVVDKVNTATPAVYWVHSDHLGRPARMTAANQTWAWDVIYEPFGAVSYSWSNPETLDIRFPGQWFQLETGLAYNWHRHYDATIGRYLQADPLRIDDKEGATVGGLPLVADQNIRARGAIYSRIASLDFLSKTVAIDATTPRRPVFPDGRSIYGYSAQNPLSKVDPKGLIGSAPFSPKLDSLRRECFIDNDNESRADRCATAYYSCVNVRGIKGRRLCGSALDNCNAGFTTIFGPGIIVP